MMTDGDLRAELVQLCTIAACNIELFRCFASEASAHLDPQASPLTGRWRATNACCAELRQCACILTSRHAAR